MLDEYDYKRNDIEIVAPFWNYMNRKLVNMYDPITKNKYKPLKLNELFWRNMYNKTTEYPSKYGIDNNSILTELLFLTMKYKTIQEIIHQSNPKSFNIIRSYNDYDNDIKPLPQMIKVKNIKTMFGDGNTKNNKNKENQVIESGEWFISTDYDPNDINNDLKEFEDRNLY